MATISGGDKLAARLAELAQRVSKPGTLEVGFLEGATYPAGPDGEPTSVATIAAYQEFGTKSIPPRPFFRTMVAEKSPKWGDAIGKLLNANDFDATKTLELVGEGIKGQLRQSIIDMNSPPLSPVTLMLRKLRSANPDLVVTAATVGEAARRVVAGESTAGVSTKPLVDRGDMLNSVDSQVK